MPDISFPIAFFSGVISFFAPCVVPLLPAYVGYVTGVSAGELAEFGLEKYRKKLILSSIFYILGFSLVFVALGTAAGGIGYLLRQFNDTVRMAGGGLIFLLGLNFAGILNIPTLSREHKFGLPAWTGHFGYGRAFLIGVVFAAAWTPCIGAILGTILALAAVSKTAVAGAALLFVYSLGISAPFIIVSLTLAQAPRYIPVISRNIGHISRVAGIVLAILGLLLLTNTYRFVNAWLFQIAYNFGYQIR